MWHTAVGYFAFAATFAIVIRHHGAPLLLVRAIVLIGCAASIVEILQADASMVGPRVADPLVATERMHPAPYQPTRDPRPDW
jgi:hypothetical protein